MQVRELKPGGGEPCSCNSSQKDSAEVSPTRQTHRVNNQGHTSSLRGTPRTQRTHFTPVCRFVSLSVPRSVPFCPPYGLVNSVDLGNFIYFLRLNFSYKYL